MKRKIRFLTLVATVVALVTISAAYLHAGARSPTETQPEQPRFRTSGVDRGNVAEFITATGTLAPTSIVNVGAQLSGTVYKIHADFNQRVKAGEVLLEIDPAIYAAQAKQAVANLRIAKAALDLAKSTYARSKELLEKKFISAAALEQQEQALVSAHAQAAIPLHLGAKVLEHRNLAVEHLQDVPRRHTAERVEPLLREIEAVFGGDGLPRAPVQRHGVCQRAVTIENNAFDFFHGCEESGVVVIRARLDFESSLLNSFTVSALIIFHPGRAS